MVAISLYRGNLHKVPDVPRKWLTPTPTISLKDFKILLHRRSKALARLQTTTSSPSPNPNLDHQQSPNQNQGKDSDDVIGSDPPPEADDRKELNGGDVPAGPPKDDAGVSGHGKAGETEIDANLGEKVVNLDDVNKANSKEERKREIEEKLKILNARKHDLVQTLKQILNAEEELKRRSSMQGLAGRPSVSLHVDVTNDSGSMTRHQTPRMGSDGILRDVEGGEADDASNHNIHSRNLLRMSSVSPSADSPHRRPFHSGVPHASRATMGASASPSRFAPTGQHGNLASVPTVSVSGTNYIASSPSPAASGGTSVFRDGRHVSPWK